MLKMAVTGDSTFPGSARLSVQGGSSGCMCAVSFLISLPPQKRIHEYQAKLMLCNSWPRLGQHGNYPAPGQVSWGIDYVSCTSRDPGEMHLQIVFQIITHWAYCASGITALRGRDCKRPPKPAGLRTSCFHRMPANCSWLLLSPAVPYPEVFLVSPTITWPRAVVGFICMLKAHLKRCWHFSK